MTKTDVLAAWAGWNNITNLNLVVGDHHPINEQFNQLAFLLKRRVGQARLDTVAERLGRGRQSRQLAWRSILTSSCLSKVSNP